MLRILLGGFVLLAALACTSLISTPAQARQVYQAFGGRGDASIVLECPAGEILVGLEGRAGSWINAMRLICAPLASVSTVGAPHPIGNFFGGRPGGAERSAVCPSDTITNGLSFLLTDDKSEVAQIKINCIAGNGNQSSAFFQGSYPDSESLCSKALGIFPKGCDPDSNERSQTCPQEYLVGLTVHSGKDVNAIGAICDVRTPPPPPKPIHHTGGDRPAPKPAPAASTGPPVAVRETVSGPWSVVLKNGSRYLFIIAATHGIDPFGRDTMPIGISGNAIAPGNIAGGLGGSMDVGRQMIVQYGLSNGTAGTCALTYTPDAQRLLGTCTENGASLSASGARASETEVAVFQNAAPAAAAAPAPAAAPLAASVAPAGGAQAVTVVQAVDLYAAAGGDDDAIGSLDVGTAGVTLIGACQGSWCHVKWPGHEGWVYNADDYRSLKF